jgi:uroporphyrinogen decarboxylase
VIAAIELRRLDRVPLDGYFRPDVWSTLQRHFNTRDDEGIMEGLGLDIRYAVLEPGQAFSERAVPCPWQLAGIGEGQRNLILERGDDCFEDETGICRSPNRTGDYWLYSYHPLAEAEYDDILGFQFPNPGQSERYAGVEAGVQAWGGRYFTVVELWNIFKSSWELRGFERYMMDLSLEPRSVEALADKILEYRIKQSLEIGRRGIDMIMISGDVAMQKGMMLSPRVWRKYFKPRLRTWLEEVRRHYDIYFMFHSDGNMESIMEDVIEIGFDVIDPIQPECMDVVAIKRLFGDQICLHGTISCQVTLPYGTVEDVRAEVLQRIDCCGQHGGLILSPSNTFQPDVALEKILCLYDTARNVELEV